ncbi:MAG: SAM-dependent DNA methyltransferase, partial [Methanobacteriota archaeon]
MEADIQAKIAELAPLWSDRIRNAASKARNEAEFRRKVASFIEDFATSLRLVIPVREERTLINGRADAVYNRLVLEYEPPRSLKPKNSYKANQHAIGQVKDYIVELSRRERHRPERLAGVVLDGFYFIFVRYKEGSWLIEEPIPVSPPSTTRFLKLLASLSTELALTPDNLVRDFGENAPVSRKTVSALYGSLEKSDVPKVKTLFDQWRLQFSEVCDYEKASKLKLGDFARKFGVRDKDINPFVFFFCLHTYYATFIKLLAVQVVHYYLMTEATTDLKQAAAFDSRELKAFLREIEEGGFFRKAGIRNFLEGDFFAWYLDVWDAELHGALQDLVSRLSEYSLLTLDADPDSTRDLLKKLYQHLMPKDLRHNLGEYYTPDWLAQRVLDMVDGGRFTGNPNKRILDPACGSGTFLVLAIKKIREYMRTRNMPESQALEKILANVVGFDLNPLAVITARTNYLLALGDLLQHRTGEITIPIYLCDSIMTPQEGKDLFGKGIVRFNTAVGPFAVPHNLVQAQYIDKLADFLEEAVSLDLSKEQFVNRLCEAFPLIPVKDQKEIRVVYELYEKLLNLQRQGINGIWARIIKNAFAPLFAGQFDYVVGNPPWVNWESLPEEYRRSTKPLWEAYGLFPHGGMDTILGKGKKDISMLMTYVAMDKYLKPKGKLGFVITQSVFKTSGAGQGFRRFQLGGKEPLRVVHVDDMVELNPFEGASNRTSVVVLQKGRPMEYPMPSYLYWRKTVKRKSIALDSTLEDVRKMTKQMRFVAEPVNEGDSTSPWITGRSRALKAVKKVLGKSNYIGRKGVTTSANAVYWIEIVAKRPDGLVVVSNITEGAKKKVESVQAVLEPDLLYPLLRGRDVQRWKAEPSAYI